MQRGERRRVCSIIIEAGKINNKRHRRRRKRRRKRKKKKGKVDVAQAIRSKSGEYVYIDDGKRVKMLNRYGQRKRTIAQREADLEVETRLYLEGKTLGMIADAIAQLRGYSIGIQQVAKDIKEVRRRWAESYLGNMNEIKTRELAKIDRLEAEYWEAWERSLRPITRTETQRAEDEQAFGLQRKMRKREEKEEERKLREAIERGEEEGTKLLPSYKRTKEVTYVEEQSGNVEYLKGVERCVRMRCEILGVIEKGRTININWREQARQSGVDPERVVNSLMEQFIGLRLEQGAAPGESPGREVVEVSAHEVIGREAGERGATGGEAGEPEGPEEEDLGEDEINEMDEEPLEEEMLEEELERSVLGEGEVATRQ